MANRFSSESVYEFARDRLSRHSNLQEIAACITAAGLLLSSCVASAAIEVERPVGNGTISTTQIGTTTTLAEAPISSTTQLAPTSTEMSTTTTMEPTTTTEITLPPTTTTTIEHPWSGHEYVDNGCDEGLTLNVHIQGENGNAISAQVSADYTIGNQKVDTSGNPIPPLEGYSDYVYINRDSPPEGTADGVRDVCFENIPAGASVYIEAYSLALTGESNPHRMYMATEDIYGHSMSHQLFPGPGQTVYMYQPTACSAGGRAGSITVAPRSGEVSYTPFRLAAWSNGRGGRPGESFGFGVEDVKHNWTEREDSLKSLASGESYLLQVQSKDPQGNENLTVINDVPVHPCQDSLVDIDITNSGCVAKVGDQTLRCALNQQMVG